MPAGKKGRSKTTKFVQSSEGEAFDFNKISDSSSVEGNPMATQATGHVRPTGSNPQAQASGRTCPLAAAPAMANSEPTIDHIATTCPAVAVPIATRTPRLAGAVTGLRLSIPTTGSGRVAQDINYFYYKCKIDVKGVMTMRKVCRLCW
jgi:hypothetical protein